MKKQELIETLEELKKNSKRVIGTNGRDLYWQGKTEAYDNALGLAKQLDEPQKPVVPQFVADYIEYCHSDGNSLWEVFRYINKMPNQVWAWLKVEKHQVVFSKAFGDGYEVEKEPLYIMPVPHLSFSVHYCVEDDHISFRQGNAQKFTQAELDKYFPDIKQLAVSVDEVKKDE